MSNTCSHVVSGVDVERVDVIIRTLCEASRRDALINALDTIDAQAGIAIRAIVVVNGQRFDSDLLDEISAREEVHLVRLEAPSLILAGLAGRDAVTAPFFTFVDDDDELIPHSLKAPARWLFENGDCDVAVCNLYHQRGEQRVLASADMSVHRANPLLTLMSGCWLHPGAALFRTASVDRTLFEFPRANMEWTTLAFWLIAAGKRLTFLDIATVVYNDTAGSLSKGPQHQEGALLALAEIIDHPVCDSGTRAVAQYKYTNTLHVLASQYWAQGRYVSAWDRHLRSLRHGGVWRYALFTRKLLRPRLRSLLPR